MLIVWGWYAMQHPRESAALEPCASCRAQKVERRTIERVWHFMGMPVVPAAMRSATVCANCKRVDIGALPAERAPRRFMTWRVVATWGLIAAAVAAGVLAAGAGRDQMRARAESPKIGDVWGVSLGEWRDATIGSAGYARFEVKDVDDGEVSLGACEYTSTTDGALGKKCRSYPIDVPDVKLGDVPGLVDRGAITSILRDGRRSTAYDTALGLFLLAAIANGLLTWRVAKKSFKPGDPLPRAAVVR